MLTIDYYFLAEEEEPLIGRVRNAEEGVKQNGGQGDRRPDEVLARVLGSNPGLLKPR
jgi:hypothetical protein